MLKEQELDAEGRHELQIRNEYSLTPPQIENTVWEEYWEQMEMAPTLKALNLVEGLSLLELACGTGRYTIKLVGKCRSLIAVDFSLGALRSLAQKLPAGAEIGLVQADITRLIISPESIDRVLSTTCLDHRDQRMAMHRLAADVLKENGRYVFGTEYYNLRLRLLGLPRAERYTPGGMLYCNLEKVDVLRESAPYFRRIKVRPIQIAFPFARYVTYKWRVYLAHIMERLPFARDFGTLLLAYAEDPIRPPLEGQGSSGNKFAKKIYGWQSIPFLVEIPKRPRCSHHAMRVPSMRSAFPIVACRAARNCGRWR